MVRQPVYRDDRDNSESSADETTPHTDAADVPDSPQRPAEFDPDDSRYDEELRPQWLKDVVGQRTVIERLQIMLNATKKRKEPLGHLLLDGPPGIGKTTLATVLPRELGAEVQMTSGPALARPADLLPYLTNAQYGSVLFIDEIHRLPPAVEEFIYPVMEDFRVDIALGEGLNARTINMKLQPFTIIGATTRSGMLSAPMRDRFHNREHLDFYDTDDIADIIRRNAGKLKVQITAEASVELARRSRGTPRKANNLLRWVRDYATDRHGTTNITKPMTADAIRMKEIDDLGLDRLDRRYLETIITVFTGGPAGLSAIAHTMNVAADTLEDEVEPFLLRCGLIQRTPRGRMLTAGGYQHMGLSGPDDVNASGKGRLF